MVILGSILAVVCGVSNSAAAVLEKLESVRATERSGLRLMGALVRRGWWLLAMALSVVGWVSEAFSLALAPVPVVTSLRGAGRGTLVLAGHRWLGERFGRLELIGVGLLVAGGAVVTVSAAGGSIPHQPLSNVTELALGAGAAVLAAVLSLSKRGLVAGAAVGVMFVATGVYTKEIGDRFAALGLAAVPALAATPGPWLMIALSVWSIGKMQGAFRQANAASVSAANTTVSSNGLIVAVAALYHEPYPGGLMLVVMVVGLIVTAAGAVALAVGASDEHRPDLAETDAAPTE